MSAYNILDFFSKFELVFAVSSFFDNHDNHVANKNCFAFDFTLFFAVFESKVFKKAPIHYPSITFSTSAVIVNSDIEIR